MLPPELGQQRRQQERCDSRNNAQPQRSRERTPALPGHLDETLDVTQAEPGLRLEILAEGSDRYLPFRSVDQLYVENRFELANRSTECRLGNEANCRRAAEVSFLTQGDKIPQLFQGRKIHNR